MSLKDEINHTRGGPAGYREHSFAQVGQYKILIWIGLDYEKDL